MKPICITEEELEYFTNVPDRLDDDNEGVLSLEEFEREAQNCITLEEFSERIGEAIRRMIPNP